MFDIEQAAFVDLRDIAAERTDRLIAWIGSGLSTAAGLPSWAGLRDALVRELEHKAAIPNSQGDSERSQARIKAIRNQPNLWVAFDMLQKSLGQTSYRAAIRRELSRATHCEVPRVYAHLWQLPLAGVVNLNLDGLATRAFHESFPSQQVYEFSGTQVGDWAHVLKSPYPFILNLHGFHADASSWVLTNAERAGLARTPACSTFIDTCLVHRTVLFLGVTVDDMAVGGYLDSLRKRRVDFGTHFWFTVNADPKADAWAERAGVRTIRYSADNAHRELLDALEAIVRFLPIEVVVPAPVVMHSCAEERTTLPPPSDVEHMEPEEARVALNAHACAILRNADEVAYREYEDFCREYGLAIHKAWYISPPYNKLFGYNLGRRIGSGAFGTVFEAEADTGQRVAVKVLREELRENPTMFQSFRRGVHSMRILSEHKLSGIVPYQDASEIPAAVIMERIDGPNLQEAVARGDLKDWATLLQVACDLTNIIRAAHLLPERVLHRDIRPPNIMLRHPSQGGASWEVLALDFDLSWHLGARELSVLETPSLSGYLAPEQVERMPSASTRNALVDSFGTGMTLYYMRTRRHPLSLEHRYSGWEADVMSRVSAHRCDAWTSLPSRFARLILYCTRDAQTDRWDMTQIGLELKRLRNALTAPNLVVSAELWAEEIAARACSQFGQGSYDWDPSGFTATIALPRGVCIELAGDEKKQAVGLRIHWMARDGQDPAGIEKYLPGKCDRAQASLKKHGWRIEHLSQATLYAASFEAFKVIPALRADCARAVAGVCEAADHLRFSPHEA